MLFGSLSSAAHGCRIGIQTRAVKLLKSLLNTRQDSLVLGESIVLKEIKRYCIELSTLVALICQKPDTVQTLTTSVMHFGKVMSPRLT